MLHTENEILTRINEDLEKRMDRADAYNARLWDAMRYSLMAGGKRIRPVMLVLTGLSLGAEEEDLYPFAEALEMIHTYSLIHDDLPAMDDDDFRRGKLTCHKMFGEAAAILAGDGLLTLAFETMGKAMEAGCRSQGGLMGQAKAMSYMAACAGPSGMVAGQIADLEGEGRRVGLEELTYTEGNKTSRLLMASLVCASFIAGAEEDCVKALMEAGDLLGQAFQIEDDILDVTGDPEKMGKPAGSDARSEKSTFVSLYGLEEAKKKAKLLTQKTVEKLEVLPGSYGQMVRDKALGMVNRTF